mgnify:CR=1 FL=1
MRLFSKIFGGSTAKAMPKPTFKKVTEKFVAKANLAENAIKKNRFDKEILPIKTAHKRASEEWQASHDTAANSLAQRQILFSKINDAQLDQMGTRIATMVDMVYTIEGSFVAVPSGASVRKSDIRQLSDSVDSLHVSFDTLREVDDACDVLIAANEAWIKQLQKQAKAVQTISNVIGRLKRTNSRLQGSVGSFEKFALGTAHNTLYNLMPSQASGSEAIGRQKGRPSEKPVKVVGGVN